MSSQRDRASRLLSYGLLIFGSALFSVPLLWMLATSVKVDRELFTDKLHILPVAPVPVRRSPYIDLREFRDLAGPRKEESLGILRSQFAARASAFPLDGSIEAAADSVYENLVRTRPAAFWNSPDLANRLRAAADAEKPGEAIRPAFRELEFGSVELLGHDGREGPLQAARAPGERWEISAPGEQAELMAPADSSFPGAALYYDFRDGGRIVLHQQMDASFNPGDFFGLRMSVVPDDSWHRLTIYVKAGERWLVARRSIYLAYTSDTATEVTWQLPGAEDHTGQIKSWVLLDSIQEPPAEIKGLEGPNNSAVYLVIDRSNPLQAWWGKLTRNYLLTFTTLPFWRYFANSVFVTTLNIFLSMFSCSVVAFSFSRIKWPGRETLFAILLATMMVPAQVVMIPQFMIFKTLGLYNTLTPLWFDSVFGNAFYIFLLRQFMKAIPRDLEDAARIDGCGFWLIYWKIILPLVQPALATVAIFTFLTSWNDFMTPLIYLNDERLYTLSLGMFSFRVQLGEGGNEALLMAACFMMVAPIIALFFFAQRYFIQGVTVTGMK